MTTTWKSNNKTLTTAELYPLLSDTTIDKIITAEDDEHDIMLEAVGPEEADEYYAVAAALGITNPAPEDQIFLEINTTCTLCEHNPAVKEAPKANLCKECALDNEGDTCNHHLAHLICTNCGEIYRIANIGRNLYSIPTLSNNRTTINHSEMTWDEAKTWAEANKNGGYYWNFIARALLTGWAWEDTATETGDLS